MSTVVHFEIPADDLDRARAFYGSLFGWKMEKPPLPMDYWLWETQDAAGQPGASGGMAMRQHPMQPIMVYFGVPSVEAYLEKIQKLGGQVLVPKMSVPGYGHLAVCLDTESNTFAIWERDRGES